MHRSGIPGNLRGRALLKPLLLPDTDAPIYSPGRSERTLLLLHVFFFFFGGGGLVIMKLYPVKVSVCISLITNEVENLYVYGPVGFLPL